jgi:hypothetical protein
LTGFFLIKLHKPVRIPDKIFPDLGIKLWKPDSGFCIFVPDPGKTLSGADPSFFIKFNSFILANYFILDA